MDDVEGFVKKKRREPSQKEVPGEDEKSLSKSAKRKLRKRRLLTGFKLNGETCEKNESLIIIGQEIKKIHTQSTSESTMKAKEEANLNTSKGREETTQSEAKKRSKQKKSGGSEPLEVVKTQQCVSPSAEVRSSSMPIRPPVHEGSKSREEVLAEREAKKKAKLAAKQKKGSSVEPKSDPVKEEKASDVKIAQNTVKEELKESKAENNAKSKSELRAERRLKQEAQRAAKETEKQMKTSAPVTKPDEKEPKRKTSIPVQLSPRQSKKVVMTNVNRVKLFSHLNYDVKPLTTSLSANVHPSIIELGAKYSARIINGSNARCVAFLDALKQVIMDYVTPSEKVFWRGLESQLHTVIDYLNQCRPISVSMINALRHLKSHLTQLPTTIPDDEAKVKLCEVIDTYINDQIIVAGVAICECVQKKISNGDQILIYSCSSLVYRLLVESYKEGTKFSVVVVDAGPWYEGREMLRRLVSHGISATYVLINAVGFIMRQATKVLLGAHALLANGYVMSRAGSAMVALMAHSYNVPVLVCCETHKFSERVQTDAFVFNELGNPDDLIEDGTLSNWKSIHHLSLLSLSYDVTPPDLVTAVVTELAILPCTSVPVILRIKPSDVAN